MSTARETTTETRTPLSKELVLRAAVELADRDGIEGLTMRHLAHELGVEAMSLYYHVANKEAILDGIVEVLLDEINQEVEAIEVPPADEDWKAAMRERILAARRVLLRHRWAPGVIESRTTMSPAMVTYYDGILAQFRQGGFSYDLAHHAMHALGSRALGFTQELFEPEGEGDQQDVGSMMEMADQFPNIVAMLSEVVHDDPDSTLGWCDDQLEFEFGLDLILDGLDRHRTA